MKEEEASLMLIRHAIDTLPEPQKERVDTCINRIKAVMGEYQDDDADMALMLIAAEVAAQE